MKLFDKTWAVLAALCLASTASAHGVPVLRSQSCYSAPVQAVYSAPVIREAVSYEVVQPPPQVIYPPAQIIERRQQFLEYAAPVQSYGCASSFQSYSFRQQAFRQSAQFNSYSAPAFQGGTNVNVNVERRGLLGGLLGGRRENINVNTNGPANVNVRSRR